MWLPLHDYRCQGNHFLLFLCSACPPHYLASLPLKKGNITAWHKKRKHKGQNWDIILLHTNVSQKTYTVVTFEKRNTEPVPLQLLYAHVLVATRYCIHTYKYAKTPFQVILVIPEKNITCQAWTGQGLAAQSPRAFWVSMGPCDLSERQSH